MLKPNEIKKINKEMKQYQFINSVWNLFFHVNFFFKNKKKIYNMLKFIQNVKIFFKLLNFYILNQNLIYNYFFQIFLKKNIQLKPFSEFNNLNLQKKYIQKGFKQQKLGIYLKNLENNFINSKMLNLNYYFLIRFNRKNLFLTLLSNSGNVLCKTNIGSCGFKKKVKSTGYAIKWTSRNFLEKITNSLIYNIYNIYYIKKKKKIIGKFTNLITKKYKLQLKKKQSNYNKNFSKLKLLNHFKKRLKIKKYINLKIENKLKKNKELNINRNTSKILKKNRKQLLDCRTWLEDKWHKSLKKIKINKKVNNILKQKNLIKINNKNKINLFFKKLKLKLYRNYYEYLKLLLKNKLKIIFRIKSYLKYWGFRFITYGLTKSFFWFRNFEIRIPIAHSTSLRLKKKRRI